MLLAGVGELVSHKCVDFVRSKWGHPVYDSSAIHYGTGISIVIAVHARPTPTATFSLNRAERGGEISMGWIHPGLVASHVRVYSECLP